jgi:hypothetical protein
MVKEENVTYYNANKFVLSFLSTNASPELLELWKSKQNLHKFKAHMRPNKPNLPRRPMSEYIYFCREERPKIQEYMKVESNSEVVNIHKVTCELGRRWQNFKIDPDPELKQRLRDLAELDSERYHQEKVIVVPPGKKKKYLRSKYLFFCREQRLIEPKILMKELGERWELQKDNKDLTRRYENAKARAVNAVAKAKSRAKAKAEKQTASSDDTQPDAPEEEGEQSDDAKSDVDAPEEEGAQSDDAKSEGAQSDDAKSDATLRAETGPRTEKNGDQASG